jgi:hypothetical protein
MTQISLTSPAAVTILLDRSKIFSVAPGISSYLTVAIPAESVAQTPTTSTDYGPYLADREVTLNLMLGTVVYEVKDSAGGGAVSAASIVAALDEATPEELAEIKYSAAGDAAPEKLAAKLATARIGGTKQVMPTPPTVTTSASAFAGFALGFPSVVTSNANWTGIAYFWGGFMARATNRIKPRVATATPLTATDPLSITGFDDAHSGMSFVCDADVIALHVNTSNTVPFRFAVDEQDGSGPRLVSLTGTQAVSTGDNYIKLDFTAAGGAKERIIHIEGPASWAFSRVFVATGSAYKVWSPATADYVRIGILHDSYGVGPVTGQYSVPAPINHDGWVPEIIRMFRYRCNIFNSSIGGSGLGVQGGGPKASFDEREFDLLNLMPDGVTKRSEWEPELVVIPGSINNNSTADEVLTAKLDEIYAYIRARKPLLPMIFTGPSVRPSDTTGQALGNNQLYREWVASKISAGDRRIAFVSVTSDAEKWFYGTGRSGAPTNDGINDIMIGTDAAHPSYVGHPYYAQRQLSAWIEAVRSMS